MQTHLQIIGYALISLALIHLVFPRYFNWKTEFHALSLVTKQIMGVHTFFIALTVFAMGLLCLVSTDDLLKTNLGKTLCLGLGVFWGVRFLFQLFVYSPKLWKGKAFETIVHILFSLLWIYLSSIFLTISFT
ncbi:MAG: hypothetical protein ACON5F_00625 [Jejuia sp.]